VRPCNPGGYFGGKLALSTAAHTSTPVDEGGFVGWQAARAARSVPQRSHLTGTGCVWTGGKRSDFCL